MLWGLVGFVCVCVFLHKLKSSPFPFPATAPSAIYGFWPWCAGAWWISEWSIFSVLHGVLWGSRGRNQGGELLGSRFRTRCPVSRLAHKHNLHKHCEGELHLLKLLLSLTSLSETPPCWSDITEFQSKRIFTFLDENVSWILCFLKMLLF